MFTVYCRVLEAETIIWPSAITAIDNTDEGIVVHFACSCGQHGGRVVTGKRAAAVAA